jgi:hypothetical protein
VVTSEGLSLHGIAAITLPPPAQKGLKLQGSVTTSSSEVIGSGTTLAILPLCPPAEFPYTEYAQHQTATYTAIATLLGTPLKLEWWILAGDGVTKVELNGPQSTVSFASQTYFPEPLPGGSFVDNQIVHLGFTKSGNTIQLTNTPSEGNYIFALYVRVGQSRREGRSLSCFPPEELLNYIRSILISRPPLS